MPGRHPIPRDHATAPSPTHRAAFTIPGERTGVAAKLGERRFYKVALPETASNHYIFRWLNGRALDSGQSVVRLISLSLRFRFFFLLYYCTNVVYTWWDGGLLVDRLFCCTLLYCCSTMVHASWVTSSVAATTAAVILLIV